MAKNASALLGVMKKMIDSMEKQKKEVSKAIEADSLSEEEKKELEDKASELDAQITGFQEEIAAVPEETTLEEQGVKNKGPEAEAAFQALIDAGKSPEEASKLFKSFPDVDGSKEDKDEGDEGDKGDPDEGKSDKDKPDEGKPDEDKHEGGKPKAFAPMDEEEESPLQRFKKGIHKFDPNNF